MRAELVIRRPWTCWPMAALALLSSCAWTLMDPVPSNASASPSTVVTNEAPRCTETEGWAIWDTAIGTSTIIVGGVQLAVAHETGSAGFTRALGVANLAAGGMFIASALLGYQRAEQCALARDAYFSAR